MRHPNQQIWRIHLTPEGRDHLIRCLQECQMGGDVTMEHPLSGDSDSLEPLEPTGNKTIFTLVPADELQEQQR